MDAAQGAALAQLERAAKQATADEAARVEALRRRAQECTELAELVTELPERTTHPVMVPFGGAAFFEGALVHTNELTCHLGADVYAERSAVQAAALLRRRAAAAAAEADAAAAELDALRARADALGEISRDAAGFFEIREDWDESAAAAAAAEAQRRHDAAAARPPPRPRATRGPEEADDALMARLAELELEEERAEAQERADRGSSKPPPPAFKPGFLDAKPRRKEAQQAGPPAVPPAAPPPPQPSLAFTQTVRERETAPPAPPAPEAARPKSRFKAAREAGQQ